MTKDLIPSGVFVQHWVRFEFMFPSSLLVEQHSLTPRLLVSLAALVTVPFLALPLSPHLL